MDNKCIYCGFVGTNDEMADHAGMCEIILEGAKPCDNSVCAKCSNYYGECQLSSGEMHRCLANNYKNYVTYQCINGSCNWEGKKIECSYFKHDTWHVRPLCPECREVVEINTK